MRTATHPVAPEEIMAWLDGELAASDSHDVAEHITSCSECATISDRLRETSRALSDWVVQNAPGSIDAAVRGTLAKHSRRILSRRPLKMTRLSFLNWKLWAIGGAGLAVGIALLVTVLEFRVDRPAYLSSRSAPEAIKAEIEPREVDSRLTSMSLAAGGVVDGSGVAPATATRQGPMIARTASLTIQVKDFGAARSSLDSIIAKHDGYSANLTVYTPENGQRHFQGSLRIPANELTPALGDLKTLGRTLNESQSGEEVTQQHTDLLARLENARQTESRLRAILQQRTGKIEDVLQVEQEIARVRGEIESMEAEQRTLEHRVAFASVDLQLIEEYEERFNPSPVSTTGRLHNAFVTGMRNASGTVLGLILFLEEFGPPFLIWAAILGIPGYFALRRYQKVRARF
jgi:hypothetical protein